jgi:hypothetical protein
MDPVVRDEVAGDLGYRRLPGDGPARFIRENGRGSVLEAHEVEGKVREYWERLLLEDGWHACARGGGGGLTAVRTRLPDRSAAHGAAHDLRASHPDPHVVRVPPRGRVERQVAGLGSKPAVVVYFTGLDSY